MKGCTDGFSLSSGGVGAAVGSPRTPRDCARAQPGAATGQARQRMTARFAPGNPAVCLPNTYPNITPGTPGAKRVVIVMITDFSAFNGGGNVTVPVVTYGAFYITGWDGAPSDCDTKNEPFSHTGHAGSSNDGDIWGHFITYVDGAGKGVPGVCDPTALLPCVPVLTQ